MSLTIERLGHHGDGIAPGPVYVPLSLPGEVVEGEIVAGRIPRPKIIVPSSDRVAAPCRHFRSCGGCAVQHASDAFVAAWKADMVRTALAAQGLEAVITKIHTSLPQSRRRATLAARRTKRRALVGLHARGSNVITEIPGCKLLLSDLVDRLSDLQALTMIAASRSSELAIAITWSEAGADIDLRDAKPLDRPLRVEAAAFSQRPGIARLTWNGETVAEQHPPVQRFDGIAVAPPPGAFLQATQDGQDALTDAVRRVVGSARTIADLFAGCGTFALPLARRAAVHAVESHAGMLEALDAGWRKTAGLKRVTTETRDLSRRPLLPAELDRFAAVVIDPPRAGAEAQMREIAQSRVPRIAAVSCHPASFARDARILTQAGYRLDWIEVVDQFRWSPHVELAAQFTKDHIAA